MPSLPLDLVFLPFAEAHAEAPERAVAALQALLLDERACRARAAWLREMRQRAGVSANGADFSREIDLIVTAGVAGPLRDGRLSIERLDALTCDPEALRRAHEALREGPGPASSAASTRCS